MLNLTVEERKEKFFSAIHEKKELESMLAVKETYFYESVIWGTDLEENKKVTDEIIAMQNQLQELKLQIAELRTGYTRKELRELRREFYAETLVSGQ